MARTNQKKITKLIYVHAWANFEHRTNGTSFILMDFFFLSIVFHDISGVKENFVLKLHWFFKRKKNKVQLKFYVELSELNRNLDEKNNNFFIGIFNDFSKSNFFRSFSKWIWVFHSLLLISLLYNAKEICVTTICARGTSSKRSIKKKNQKRE